MVQPLTSFSISCKNKALKYLFFPTKQGKMRTKPNDTERIKYELNEIFAKFIQ